MAPKGKSRKGSPKQEPKDTVVEEEEDTTAWLEDYVRTALLQKLHGESEEYYRNLVQELSRLKQAVSGQQPDCMEAQALASLLHALSASVSVLSESRHDALIGEILDLRLWSLPQAVREAALEVMGNLVVTSGSLVNLCLQALVAALLPPPWQPTAAGPAGPGEAWQASPLALEVQGEVLACLQKVLSLVPTASSRLLPLLRKGLPHKMRDREAQCLYLQGLLALAESGAGAPLREALLGAVVEHLLSLDVEIKWQDLGILDPVEEETEHPDEAADIFELEGMSGLEISAELAQQEPRQALGFEGAHQQEPAGPNPRSVAVPVDEMADKLDSMMALAFGHLERRCAAGQLAAAWDSLLQAFELCLLSTQRSKFTQFLLFYLFAREPEMCGRRLLDLLLDRLTSPSLPLITRSAAAAYLASFLARAALTPQPLLVDALQRLAGWCLGYVREVDARAGAAAAGSGAPVLRRAAVGIDSGASSADVVTRHQVFYAACQGLLYVLCYHVEGLLAGPHASQLRQLFQDVMPELLHHRLSPLSVCIPAVVAEFTRKARALRLMDTARLVGAAGPDGHPPARTLHRPLEMFFPFDPYLLRVSSRHLQLERTYTTWSAGPSHGEEDEEGEHGTIAAEAGAQSEGGAAEDDSPSDTDSESESEDERGSESESSSESSDEEEAGSSPDMPHLAQPYLSMLQPPLPAAFGGFPRQLPMPISTFNRSLSKQLANGQHGIVLPTGHKLVGGCGGDLYGISPMSGMDSPVPMSCTPGA